MNKLFYASNIMRENKEATDPDDVYDFHDSKRLVGFLRIGCQFFGNWPAKSHDPSWKLTLMKISLFIHVANELLGAVAIFNGLHCCYSGLSEHIKSFVEVTFMFETLYNIAYYEWKASQFQILADEMEHFFITPHPDIRGVKLNYLKRMKLLFYILAIFFVICGVFFIISPLISVNRLTPVNTVYPLIPIDEPWGRSVTYALNILHIVNAASVLFFDLLLIAIMSYAACKFSLAGVTLKTVDEEGLSLCIRRHQEAIRFASKLNHVMAPIAVKSTVAVALYVIVSGLIVIHDLPLIELSKFFTVTIFSLLRYLACSWTADVMIHEAHDIASDIFYSSWMNENPRIRKQVVVIIQRCQKPIAIQATGFLSAWSLNFCGRVLYSIFAYFTTLRAALRV